jgi:hypothetical protein
VAKDEPPLCITACRLMAALIFWWLAARDCVPFDVEIDSDSPLECLPRGCESQAGRERGADPRLRNAPSRSAALCPTLCPGDRARRGHARARGRAGEGGPAGRPGCAARQRLVERQRRPPRRPPPAGGPRDAGGAGLGAGRAARGLEPVAPRGAVRHGGATVRITCGRFGRLSRSLPEGTGRRAPLGMGGALAVARSRSRSQAWGGRESFISALGVEGAGRVREADAREG